MFYKEIRSKKKKKEQVNKLKNNLYFVKESVPKKTRE
jgi:hypothetical protein